MLTKPMKWKQMLLDDSPIRIHDGNKADSTH